MTHGAKVELIVGDGGRIVIYGSHPVRGGEYEYSVTIDGDQVEVFARALGTSVDGIRSAWDEQCEGIVEVGEPKWLKAHGVKYEFQSWMTPHR